VPGDIPIRDLADDQLWDAYQAFGSIWKAAEALGVSGQSLHRRLHSAGYVLSGSGKKWSDEDTTALCAAYQANELRGDLDLSSLAESMGRTPQYLCRKAGELGLTKKTRAPNQGMRSRMSAIMREKWYSEGDEAGLRLQEGYKRAPHPRGMAGKKHSAATKERIGVSSKAIWESMPEERKAQKTMRMMQTRAKNGNYAPPRPKATWKAGWRIVAGRRVYFRSRWEANYARYLQFLKERGDILEWEHEPITFWFKGIKRGTVSYLPDFRVTENNSDIAYHEVKGYMDQRSRTKLERMRRQYPSVRLILIDRKPYMEIERKLGRIIEGWEAAA